MAYTAARAGHDHDAGHAFIVLLKGRSEAESLATVLGRLDLPQTSVAVPPTRGLMFFADPSAELDTWWGANVPRDAEPVYIIGDEPGMLQWIANVVDGSFVVGVHEPADTTPFAALDRARAVVIADVADYAITVAHDFGGVAASVASAAIYGDPTPATTPRQSARRAKKFRRARLDANTELMVAVPTKARPRAPRQVVVTADPTSRAGSEAFFHPTTNRPAVLRGKTEDAKAAFA